MLFARISFVPNNDHEEAELVSAAEHFLSALYRNGQIVGDYVTGWYDGVFDAVVHASHRDALQPRYHSRWVKEALVEIHASFGGDPICEVIDDNVSVPVPTLKSAASLFLYCDSVSRTSPVRHGNRGTPIAVPLLPISDELRDEICDWTTAWCSHDRLFFGGGPLEIAAYHQLADPFSELMSEGRRLSAAIEQAVGVMVYCYVLRHWGLSEGENSRICPGCGQPWSAAGSPFPSREPFQRFHFRCDACRLVSHAAATGEDEELARIGEFDPAKTISPRPAPAGPELARVRDSETVDEERGAVTVNQSAGTPGPSAETSDSSAPATAAAGVSSADLPAAPPLAVDRPESDRDNDDTSASADVVPGR
ncbi:MAG: DUF2310 family Zn-ribbon-containing protein [Planctomycetaceae bacterium]|nr:DUF2310 family Zn-ribbon-containing protein [Planctomycetaceae bacterium]